MALRELVEQHTHELLQRAFAVALHSDGQVVLGRDIQLVSCLRHTQYRSLLAS
jgi:histone H3/H4